MSEGLPCKLCGANSTKPKKKRRSLNQNAYWFGVLDKYAVPQFKQYGDRWDSFSIHEMIMIRNGFIEPLLDPNGEPFPARMESKKFSTQEWEEFMDIGRAFLSENYGIVLPIPNETSYKEIMEFYESK